MVHCFIYKHKEKDIHFVYDIASGSLLNVDSECYLLAKERYQTLTSSERAEFDKIPKGSKQEISKELDEMELSATLNNPDTVPKRDKSIGEIKALCLHICHDCNMRCRYCFAGEGNYHSKREMMSLDVGKKAIDFLIANSGSRTNLEVDFFGGEPLMNLDVVKAIVSYARAQESHSGKNFSFTMTTNCLLLDDDTIEYLDREMCNVVLSIDGRPNVHNAARKTLNGKDAYQTVLERASKFARVRGNRPHYVRGTFTRDNLDFASDIIHLRDCGFKQISMEPVVLEATHPMAIRESDIPTILEEYTRLAQLYLDSREAGKDKWFNFFHFMVDLEGGPCIIKRLTGCGAGCEYLAVAPTGEIYPCHQFAGLSEYCLGSVLDGNWDLTISKTFSKNVVTQKTECEECFAKYYCSGGCAANAINFGGGIDKVYKLSCQMMRHRFQLSLAIWAIENSKN